MTIQAVSSVSTKLFGKPMKYVDDENPRVEMGRFMGVAVGVFDRVGPNGEIMQGFRGTFEIENFKTGETFRSALAYLPNALADSYRALFIDAETGEPIKGATATFDFTSIAIKDSNAAGFRWSHESNQPLDTQTDMLSALRAKNDEMKRGLLEAPKAENTEKPASKKHKQGEAA